MHLNEKGLVFINDCIYHYGVKGMRWGVRRYLTEDGTLTEAGRKKKRVN